LLLLQLVENCLGNDFKVRRSNLESENVGFAGLHRFQSGTVKFALELSDSCLEFALDEHSMQCRKADADDQHDQAEDDQQLK